MSERNSRFKPKIINLAQLTRNYYILLCNRATINNLSQLNWKVLNSWISLYLTLNKQKRKTQSIIRKKKKKDNLYQNIKLHVRDSWYQTTNKIQDKTTMATIIISAFFYQLYD
jgi:hypothetical protein